MTCERIRAQLTSYLDGELDSDAGTVVRGHLRTCDACRAIAADEAVLRDGLRSLPPLDPPNSLWAGVQARLAAEEVAESKRPAWRRALSRGQQSWQRASVILFGARWQRFVPQPRVAIAGALVAAAAVGVIYWKTRTPDAAPAIVDNTGPKVIPPQQFAPHNDVAKQAPPPVRPNCTTVAEASDVSEDLQLDGKRTDAAYDCAIEELLAEAAHIRTEWTDVQRSAFDDKVKAMRESLAKAGEGKPRQRAARAMIAYLQGAVTRDQVLLAGVP